MSKRPIPVKNIWDKTTQLDNKPTVSIRTATVVAKVRELHNISEGKAVEGLMNGNYNYNEILELLKNDYRDI